jgi:hypothetical protein
MPAGEPPVNRLLAVACVAQDTEGPAAERGGAGAGAGARVCGRVGAVATARATRMAPAAAAKPAAKPAAAEPAHAALSPWTLALSPPGAEAAFWRASAAAYAASDPIALLLGTANL